MVCLFVRKEKYIYFLFEFSGQIIFIIKSICTYVIKYFFLHICIYILYYYQKDRYVKFTKGTDVPFIQYSKTICSLVHIDVICILYV